MQQQLQNLKALVHTSRILNESERFEWLSLLEVMTDKQLGELEQILKTGIQPIPVSIPPVQKAPVFKPLTLPVVSKKEDFKHEPLHLSHIMNLPNAALKIQSLPTARGDQKMVPSPQPKNTKTVLSSSPQTEKKPAVGFFQKFKNMLSEKELPSGRAEYPLELSAPSSPVSKPQVAFAVEAQERKPVSFSGVTQVQTPAPERVTTVPHVPAPALPKVPLPKLTKPPEPVVPKALNFDHLSVGSLSVGEILQKKPVLTPASTFRAGLNGYRTEAQDTVRASDVATNKFISGIEEKRGRNHIPLQTLDEAAVLGVDAWLNSDQEALVRDFKKLISNYGYHEVVFSIEKSPLYKSYLDTGIYALTDKTSPQDKAVGKLLTHPQFEKFMDMLREIQAG